LNPRFVPIPLAVLAQEIYVQAKDYRRKLIKQLYEAAIGKPSEPATPEDKPKQPADSEGPPGGVETPAALNPSD
jgi:hypothetical protein